MYNNHITVGFQSLLKLYFSLTGSCIDERWWDLYESKDQSRSPSNSGNKEDTQKNLKHLAVQSKFALYFVFKSKLCCLCVRIVLVSCNCRSWSSSWLKYNLWFWYCV